MTHRNQILTRTQLEDSLYALSNDPKVMGPPKLADSPFDTVACRP